MTPLMYLSLGQLALQPHGVLLTYAVRASFIFFIILFGFCVGAVLLAYKLLRRKSALFNALLAACLYIPYEMLLFYIFGGYNYASLSHAVVSFPPALWYAGLGGAILVSFIIAACNAMLAEVVYGWQKGSYRAGAAALLFFTIIAGGAAAAYCLRPAAAPGAVLATSIIQPAPPSVGGLPFGSVQEGVFVNDALAPSISSAAQKSSLVVYPFSPVRGIVYRDVAPASTGVQEIPDSLIGKWLQTVTPASVTVVVWNTMSAGGALYDEYAFWKGGEKSEYRKRELYALSDYTPVWAEWLGLRRLPYTITPGEQDNRVEIGGVPVGTLICSELHQVGLARREASRGPFIVAIGSDTMFPGDMGGNWSLAAARYRAAENGVFVLRGNAFGPSAFIKEDGSIQNMLPFGEQGTLVGYVPLQKSHPTIYSRWGAVPLGFLLVLVVASALLARVYLPTAPGSLG